MFSIAKAVSTALELLKAAVFGIVGLVHDYHVKKEVMSDAKHDSEMRAVEAKVAVEKLKTEAEKQANEVESLPTDQAVNRLNDRFKRTHI